LPEDQRQTVEVANTELPPAIEGRIQILVETYFQLRRILTRRARCRAELTMLERVIECFDAIGEEPQADVPP
jgi:hypothetical protein